MSKLACSQRRYSTWYGEFADTSKTNKLSIAQHCDKPDPSESLLSQRELFELQCSLVQERTKKAGITAYAARLRKLHIALLPQTDLDKPLLSLQLKVFRNITGAFADMSRQCPTNSEEATAFRILIELVSSDIVVQIEAIAEQLERTCSSHSAYFERESHQTVSRHYETLCAVDKHFEALEMDCKPNAELRTRIRNILARHVVIAPKPAVPIACAEVAENRASGDDPTVQAPPGHQNADCDCLKYCF